MYMRDPSDYLSSKYNSKAVFRLYISHLILILLEIIYLTSLCIILVLHYGLLIIDNAVAFLSFLLMIGALTLDILLLRLQG